MTNFIIVCAALIVIAVSCWVFFVWIPVNRRLKEFDYHKRLQGDCYAVQKDGKWGIANSLGKLLTEVVYDDIGSVVRSAVYAQSRTFFTYAYAVMVEGENGKKCHGLFSEEEGWIAKPIYDWLILCWFQDFALYDCNNTYVRVARNGKSGIIVEPLVELVPCEYCNITQKCHRVESKAGSNTDDLFYFVADDGKGNKGVYLEDGAYVVRPCDSMDLVGSSTVEVIADGKSELVSIHG